MYVFSLGSNIGSLFSKNYFKTQSENIKKTNFSATIKGGFHFDFPLVVYSVRYIRIDFIGIE